MKFLSCILLFAFSFFSCKKTKDTSLVSLYFTKNYKDDSWQKQRTGMLWALSYLGASLPKGSLDSAIQWKDSSHFNLDLKRIGFTNSALKVLSKINDSIQRLPEYQKHGAIPLGQFVSLLIGSSPHYYQITNAEPDLNTLMKKHQQDTLIVYPVYHSSISKRLRVLRLYISSNIEQSLFVAQEGRGDISDGSFNAETSEVFDIMPNGQLRFAIYNEKGMLINGSEKIHSDAGKSAKCMWCHELNIQPLFTKNENKAGYLTQEQFQTKVVQWQERLNAHRKTILGDVNFENKQDHTQMELLYISYIEPSAKQLASEWRLSEKEVRVLLKSFVSHQHEEFKFLDTLYWRNAVEQLKSTYPLNIRETGQYELDFTKAK
jgi:hypothetical protein